MSYMKILPKLGLATLLFTGGCAELQTQYNPRAAENPILVAHKVAGEFLGKKDWQNLGEPDTSIQYVEPQDRVPRKVVSGSYVNGIRFYGPNTSEGVRVFAVCNELVDSNGNGFLDIPQDFKGVYEKTFVKGRDPLLVFMEYKNGTQGMQFQLINTTDTRVFKQELIPDNTTTKTWSYAAENRLTPGKYQANWKSTSGELLERIEFSVEEAH